MMRWIFLLILSVVCGSYTFAQVKVPYIVSNGLQLTGVDETNPVIYDNDLLVDTPEVFYLWLKANKGQVRLVGNINTRDMYNNPNYQFSHDFTFVQWTDIYNKAIQSNLKNIPAPVKGADAATAKPASGIIEQTPYKTSVGSDLIISEAHKASPEKPLCIFVGGNVTSIAHAYLKDNSIANKIIVFHVGGYKSSQPNYNSSDFWSTYIVMKRIRYVNWSGDQYSWYDAFRPLVLDINGMPTNAFTNALRSWYNDAYAAYKDIGDAPPILYFFNHSLWKNVVRKLENDQTTTSDTFDYLLVSENDWTAYGPMFSAYVKDPANYNSSTPANVAPVVSLTGPANNSSYAAGASITITANATDSDGSVSKVEFFNGTTKLGEDLTSPYSFVWASVPVGNYSITAKATDNQAAVTTSSAIAVSVTGNPPPTVSITAPTNNALVATGSTVAITATAADANGAINKVEFFVGTLKLGEDLTSPYSLDWGNVAAGAYAITAVATDNQGAVTTSSAINITVSSTNNPPVVSLTAPANNSSFSQGSPITITANASDVNGAISKVEFYNGATKIGEDATTPYTFVWTNVPIGTYSITAKATDNQSAVSTSTAVTIIVTTANIAPVVNLTSPAINATFPSGATITLIATASDATGSIVKVEFFQGTTKVGEDTSIPYSIIWANVPAGSYSLSAKATDNQGAVSTSALVPINVGSANTPPVVNITSPVSNATFLTGSSITIAASASDANGTVAKVEFYQGTTKLGEDITTPYSFVWTNVPAGSYTIVAKASDNQGAIISSTPIPVTIITNAPPVVNLTSPANNSTFNAGSSITISATATDATGTINQVEFYNGTTKLGQDVTSPYSFVWSNVPAGNYVLTAKALDSQDASATSQAVTISVLSTVNPTAQAGEDVFLTLPENSLTLTGVGVSGDGSAIQYNWVQLSGPSIIALSNATLPKIDLVNLQEGTYIFELTVTDAKGLSAKDQVKVIIGATNQIPQSAIPRYFTPNEDGINDFWEWPTTELFENSVLTIFNRFGQKIYEAVSYKNTWDGKIDGKPLQEDAYYYIIRLLNQAEIKGAVRIIH